MPVSQKKHAVIVQAFWYATGVYTHISNKGGIRGGDM